MPGHSPAGKPSSIMARSISAAVTPSSRARPRRRSRRAACKASEPVESRRFRSTARPMALASASPAASRLTVPSARCQGGIVTGGRLGEHVRRRLGDEFAVWLSSSTAKRAGTFASNGTRCRRRSQKAWMVSILRPPGVSTARAKRRRASFTLAALGRSPSSSVELGDRAPARRASPSVRAARRRESPCWRPPPW